MPSRPESTFESDFEDNPEYANDIEMQRRRVQLAEDNVPQPFRMMHVSNVQAIYQGPVGDGDYQDPESRSAKRKRAKGREPPQAGSSFELPILTNPKIRPPQDDMNYTKNSNSITQPARENHLPATNGMLPKDSDVPIKPSVTDPQIDTTDSKNPFATLVQPFYDLPPIMPIKVTSHTGQITTQALRPVALLNPPSALHLSPYLPFIRYAEIAGDPFAAPLSYETATYTMTTANAEGTISVPGPLKMMHPHALNFAFGGNGTRTEQDNDYWQQHGLYPARKVDRVAVGVYYVILVPGRGLVECRETFRYPAAKVETLGKLKYEAGKAWARQFEKEGLEMCKEGIRSECEKVKVRKPTRRRVRVLVSCRYANEDYKECYTKNIIHGRAEYVFVELMCRPVPLAQDGGMGDRMEDPTDTSTA